MSKKRAIILSTGGITNAWFAQPGLILAIYAKTLKWMMTDLTLLLPVGVLARKNLRF